MTSIRHGLSISIEQTENEFYIFLKIAGKLTHADYQMITPIIDSALLGVKDAKVKIFVDCSELKGLELRAAWDDFKLGLKHGGKFEKVAILGNKKWLKYSSKIASWFISGEVRYFEDVKEVLMWFQE
ncbi:MAG: STAS/SEC14 domain-containing protein [Methylococcales symbiont of Hymedesmia sp. n. MRB-2018]|nr:MAG: STAS/SEC14 domain-containing protein [Methylococcales symbiont of Hymedesmia sp. n. MRB-2018]